MDLNTLLKHTSRSLYLSVKMLPATMRPTFGLAYLLCRYADTIADTHLISPEQRLHAIKHFAQAVRTRDIKTYKQLAQSIHGAIENPYEALLLTHLPDCLQALDQTPAALQPYIYDVVEAVCEGMALDLQVFTTSTPQAPTALQEVDDLTHYCRLMGGKPGLFWSQLIYHTQPVHMEKDLFFQLGQHIGDALQIVNVLRDLPKDLQLGRCYFPQEQLSAYGLTPKDLTNPASAKRFEPIKRYWLLWGKEKLQHATKYWAALPKANLRTRAAVAWTILLTAYTFNKLAAQPDLLNPNKRVKVPRSTIYFTMLVTPALWASNTIFNKWLHHKLNKLP